jgi:tRNA A37 N6-isopentenylltransferase MiaA
MKDFEGNVVYVIVGETGCGKTSFSLRFAHHVGGEIINIDLSQIYSFIPIGTGQIPLAFREGIPHHLFGFKSTPDSISIFQMRKMIEITVLDVLSRGKVPILVGGSHFLALALFFSREDFFCLSEDSLYYKKVFPPCSWFPLTKREGEDIFFCPRFFYRFVALERLKLHSREEILLQRITAFFASGWIQEVLGLTEKEKDFVLKKKFIGYPEIVDFLSQHNNESLCFENLCKKILVKTLQYGKKQRTFLRKLERHMYDAGIPFFIAKHDSCCYGRFTDF